MRSDCDFFLGSFFRDRHFVRLQPPIITSSDCEGAGEVFTVSSNQTSHSVNLDGEVDPSAKGGFFQSPKYLTVSSQLHLEAFVHEHKRVWTLSPTFRAEKSDTPRHVSEFWMLEVEMQTGRLQDVMDLVEEMIQSLIASLQNTGFMNELAFASRGSAKSPSENVENARLVERRWEGLGKHSWPRITYSSAVQKLREAVELKEIVFQHEPSWLGGLQLEHERYIVATVGQGNPVFVTDYPKDLKPFYMLVNRESQTSAADSISAGTVACFDLLLPDICEVAGGSLREHGLEHLIQSMHTDKPGSDSGSLTTAATDGEMNLSAGGDDLDWYVDLRRYGSVPHGGFGLGFDRLLGYLAGISNIKDVVPWPRYYGRCDC